MDGVRVALAVMLLLWAGAARAFWNGAGDTGAPAAAPPAAAGKGTAEGRDALGLPSACTPVSGCPIASPGAMIVGYCQSTTPLFSTANAQELLAILGSLVTQESLKHRELNKTLAETLGETIRQLLIEYGTAQAVERAHGAGARPLTACTSGAAAPAMRQGELARRGQQEAAAEDDRQYTMTGRSEGQVLHRLLGLAQESGKERNWRRFEYRALFGDGAARSGETPNSLPYTLDIASDGRNLERARDFIQTAIAPAPLGMLSADLAKSAAGQKYEAARLLWQSEVSAPEWVLNEILALHSGLIDPGGWALTAWEDLGYGADVPTGAVSKSDYFQLMSMSRAGNNRWHNRVTAQLNEAGLLREMAVMQATQLEIQREQLTFLEHIAGMLALGRAAESNRTSWATARALLTDAIAQRNPKEQSGLPTGSGENRAIFDPYGSGAPYGEGGKGNGN